MEILLGLITGIVFGFLLQKAEVLLRLAQDLGPEDLDLHFTVGDRQGERPELEPEAQAGRFDRQINVELPDLDERKARERINPYGVLKEVAGKDVLCLASGGGQQSAAFGVLGARVTVFEDRDGTLTGTFVGSFELIGDLEGDVALDLEMADPNYGWTVEMALRAAHAGWRVAEVPVNYRSRQFGQSKYGLGRITRVLVPPDDSPAADFAFDVTPARLVTGFITERGVCDASSAGIHGLFPEY